MSIKSDIATSIIRAYPDDYPEKCFQFWYAAGKPSLNRKLCQQLPKVDGRTPNIRTIMDWARNYNWKGRAEDLDVKALQLSDQNLLSRKVKMLDEIAKDAEKIQKKALDYLMTEGFDSAASAVQAAFKSFETRMSTAGLSEAILNMSKLSKDELLRKIRDMAEREEGVEVIETAEFEPTEDEKENGE